MPAPDSPLSSIAFSPEALPQEQDKAKMAAAKNNLMNVVVRTFDIFCKFGQKKVLLFALSSHFFASVHQKDFMPRKGAF